MISLSRINEVAGGINLRRPHYAKSNRSSAIANKLNRYSEMYPSGVVFNLTSTDSVSCADSLAQKPSSSKATSISSSKGKQMTTTITKHCISNPCAFQHINSLKDNDQHVKMLIDTFSLTNSDGGVGVTHMPLSSPLPSTLSSNLINNHHSTTPFARFGKSLFKKN